jgi:hypothetical protein
MPPAPPGRLADRNALGDAQQLDAVAQLFGIADVGRLQRGDAFDVGLVELHRDAERDGAHDRGLVRGVHAFDVEGRVGLGITQLLRLLQHGAEVQALGAHLERMKLVVPLMMPATHSMRLAVRPSRKRLDDRDATGHRRLEGHDHALVARRGEDLAAVHGQQAPCWR